MKNAIYSEAQKKLRWSSFKNSDPDTLFVLFTQPQIDLDNLTAFEFMKQLGSSAGVFAKYMKGATFMIPTPRLLDQVVQMIDKIKMDDRDTKGDLYEYLLSKIATAGTNGQFRTPRHIIKMMVEMMKPTREDKICDPSCGSAGFLVAASEYFHQHQADWFHEQDFREHYNSDMFTGIEFDATMLRIGAMNLQLHGIENPQLIGVDALSEVNADKRDQFSLILANPPFKGSLDFDSVEGSLLKIVKTKKTELLFLSLTQQIFEAKLEVALLIREQADSDDEPRALAEGYLNELHQAVTALDEKRFVVKAKLRLVAEYSDKSRWQQVSKSDVQDISSGLSALVLGMEGGDELARRFDVLILNYQLALLTNAYSTDRYITKINATAKALLGKLNIDAVAAQEPLLRELQTEVFWQAININRLDEVRLALRDLMKFLDKDKQVNITTEFEDTLDYGGVKEHDLIPA